MKKRNKKNSEIEVQFTSMIDMVFLLLIFFMVTAKFVLPERSIPAFGMEKTEATFGGGGAGVEPFKIHLRKAQGVTVVVGEYRGEMMAPATVNDLGPGSDLGQRLTAYLADNLNDSGKPLEGVEVVIECEDSVRWEAMIRVFDIIRGVKVEASGAKEPATIEKIRFEEQT